MPVITPLGAAGEFAASRHGALSRRQAASFGLSPQVIRRMIRDQHLIEPAPGVLVIAGAPATWRQRLKVATLCSNEAGVAAFRAGAALQGMDRYPEGPVELMLESPRKLRLANVEVHVGPLDPCDVIEIDGIPCTTAARTLCDLGSVDTIGRVRFAFEWAWRNGISLDELQSTVDRLHRPGQHGSKVLQELLVEARLNGRPTESALEVRLEAILADIEGLVRQFTVTDPAGGFVARVDFAVPACQLAIEAHSRQFHFGPTAERRDRERDARLRASGWTVLYVTASDMDDPSRVRSTVRRHLRRT
jgi:very-short-patch-repair endonuclease